MSLQGKPAWYELGTNDLDAAGRFYADVFGWKVVDSGMPETPYHLAIAADGANVAGMMSNAGQEGAPPPNWVIYFAVDDADATCSAVTDSGGRVYLAPMEIPGTGRFAVLADPQGAVFGVLQPEPMEDGSAGGRAFDQQAEGHGNWQELMTSDPAAGFDFYAGLLGFTKSEALEMGEMGTYQIFAQGGGDIGGMMGLSDGQPPAWLPYFGSVGTIEATQDRVIKGGGSIHHGPAEVPGGAFIVIAQDPQGAWFGAVGPTDGTSAQAAS